MATIDDLLQAINNSPSVKEACFNKCYKSGFYYNTTREDARVQFEIELADNDLRRQVLLNHFLPYYNRYLIASYKEKKAWLMMALSLIATIGSCFIQDQNTSSLVCTAGLAGLIPSSLLGCYYRLTKA